MLRVHTLLAFVFKNNQSKYESRIDHIIKYTKDLKLNETNLLFYSRLRDIYKKYMNDCFYLIEGMDYDKETENEFFGTLEDIDVFFGYHQITLDVKLLMQLIHKRDGLINYDYDEFEEFFSKDSKNYMSIYSIFEKYKIEYKPWLEFKEAIKSLDNEIHEIMKIDLDKASNEDL